MLKSNSNSGKNNLLDTNEAETVDTGDFNQTLRTSFTSREQRKDMKTEYTPADGNNDEIEIVEYDDTKEAHTYQDQRN